MKEIWKQVNGYGGKYYVSNKGNVKTLDYHQTGKEHMMKPRKDKGGYLTVSLSYLGNTNTVKIHRLVALAFLDNPNGFPFVNHKDEVKTNNIVDNLEWCTAKYNVNYSFSRHNDEFRKRQGDAERKYNSKIAQIDINGNVIRIYDNIAVAVKENGNNKNIYACVKGVQSVCMGCKWVFC